MGDEPDMRKTRGSMRKEEKKRQREDEEDDEGESMSTARETRSSRKKSRREHEEDERSESTPTATHTPTPESTPVSAPGMPALTPPVRVEDQDKKQSMSTVLINMLARGLSTGWTPGRDALTPEVPLATLHPLPRVQEHNAMEESVAQQGADARERAFATTPSRTPNSSLGGTQPGRLDSMQPQPPSQQPNRGADTDMQTAYLSSGKAIRYTPAQGRRMLDGRRRATRMTTTPAREESEVPEKEDEEAQDNSMAPQTHMPPPPIPSRPTYTPTSQPVQPINSMPAGIYASGLGTYQAQPLPRGPLSTDIPDDPTPVRTTGSRRKMTKRGHSPARTPNAQDHLSGYLSSPDTAQQIANDLATAQNVAQEFANMDEDESLAAAVHLHEGLNGAQDDKIFPPGQSFAEIKKLELALQKHQADAESSRQQQQQWAPMLSPPRGVRPAFEQSFVQIRMRENAMEQQRAELEARLRLQHGGGQNPENNSFSQGPSLPVAQGDMLPPPCGSAPSRPPPLHRIPPVTGPTAGLVPRRPGLQAPENSYEIPSHSSFPEAPPAQITAAPRREVLLLSLLQDAVAGFSSAETGPRSSMQQVSPPSTGIPPYGTGQAPSTSYEIPRVQSTQASTTTQVQASPTHFLPTQHNPRRNSTPALPPHPPHPAPSPPSGRPIAHQNSHPLPTTYIPTAPSTEPPPPPPPQPTQQDTLQEQDIQHIRTTIHNLLETQEIMARYPLQRPEDMEEEVQKALVALGWFWKGLGGRR